MGRILRSIGHAIEMSREAETGKRSISPRDLRGGAPGCGHTEQMAVATGFRSEVNRIASPVWRLGDQIEVRGQILHRSARRRHAIEIHCGSVFLMSFEDEVQPLAPQKSEVL